jgi:hypothetical protein
MCERSDQNTWTDFLLGRYLAMSSDARMIFSAKLAAWQARTMFKLDRAKLDAWNRAAPKSEPNLPGSHVYGR